MGLTREEEIKARLDNEFVHWIVDDRYFDYKVAGDSAEGDISYLLARNEELQRRAEKMQAVVDAARIETCTHGECACDVCESLYALNVADEEKK